MKRVANILIMLVTMAIVGCTTADIELDRLTNDYGSSIEYNGDIRYSTFTLTHEHIIIDNLISEVKLSLLESGGTEPIECDATLTHNIDSTTTFKMELLNSLQIADGNYIISITTISGTLIRTRVEVYISDEMVYSVLGSSGHFNLSGSGTQSSPYTISSSDEFSSFLYGLYKDTDDSGNCLYGAGLYFLQTSSFEAPDTEDSTEGEYYVGQGFAGVYNGSGCLISYSRRGSGDDGGLFKALYDGAKVSNLYLYVNMSGVHNNYAGGLSGRCSGDVELSDILVIGEISDCGDDVGGLIGYACDGTIDISNCQIRGGVSGVNYVGGLIGRAQNCAVTIDDFDNTDEDDIFSGNLFTVSASGSFAGGLVGAMDGNSSCHISNVRIKNSISQEDAEQTRYISADSSAGGLFGYLGINSASSFTSINIQSPVYAATQEAGGLIGRSDISSTLTLSDCGFYSYASGGDYVGGLFGKVDGSSSIIFDGDTAHKLIMATEGYYAVNGGNYVGSIAGYFSAGISINQDITINIPVSGNNYVGGVFGYLNSDSTIGCTHFGFDHDMVISGAGYVGGIVGKIEDTKLKGSESLDIPGDYLPSADYFTPNVYMMVVGSGTAVGGVVGEAEDSEVRYFCFSGSVSGHDAVGGIVGRAIGTTSIYNCVNKAAAVSSANYDGGGIVGGHTSATNCKYEYLINYSDISCQNPVGGIIGYMNALANKNKDITIANCYNSGNITGSSRGYGTGGIIGHFTGDEFPDETSGTDRHYLDNLVNYGDITGSGSGELCSVGGIGGAIYGERKVLTSSANHGDIHGGSGAINVGGIVGIIGRHAEGWNMATALSLLQNYYVSSCVNRGTISSSYSEAYLGGIAGFLNEGGASTYQEWWSLTDCYNAGDITTEHDDNPGGIVGCMRDEAVVKKSINIGEISHGNGCVGSKSGILLTHEDLYYLEGTGGGKYATEFTEKEKSDPDTFENFDFDTVWALDDKVNSGYPYLRDCPFQFD